MDAQAILELYDKEMRGDATANRANIHKRPGLTYFLALPPSPRAGWVIYTRLDAANVDEAISSTADFFSDKGPYKALVQRRAREARERGVRFLVVDTSPMSGPILQRHSFVFLTHAQGFVMDFGKSSTAGASAQ